MAHLARASLVSVASVVAVVIAAWPVGARGGRARATEPPQAAAQAMTAGLQGWEFVTDPAMPISDVCTVRPDRVIAVSGSPVGYLATVSSHRSYRLHAEWRWPGKTGNGGVSAVQDV